MDNRDEIIRTQLDVIGTLLDSNIRRMSDDIWGKPATEKKDQPAAKTENKAVLSQSQILCDKTQKSREYPCFFAFDYLIDGDYIFSVSSFSRFLRFRSMEQCTYRFIVMDVLACPRISLRLFISKSTSTHLVAKVWRSV